MNVNLLLNSTMTNHLKSGFILFNNHKTSYY